MKILYFAGFRQRIGIGEEDVCPPDTVRDVAALVEWLKQRSPEFAGALADISTLRVAVNQEFASFDTELSGSEEVAFFPPMTGG